MMLPPTGKPTHAKLYGGPHGGEIVPLVGTHAIAAPIMKKNGHYWYFMSIYVWERRASTREVVGRWSRL